MTGLLAWIVGPIAGPLLGGLFAVSLLGWGITSAVNHFEFADMQKQRDAANELARAAQRTTDVCAVNVATLDVSLNRNISQIKEWQKQGEDATKRAQDATETVRKTVAGVRVSVGKLLSAAPTAPVGSFESCQAGIQALRGGVP